ncbi:RND transporter [Pseudoalteromonas citrea]|uniref:RND transporter n=1 Tax=Pseudoalteromonas citrea TaxID=43655 RepID=A0A5S3XUB2_9GAMM|nr:TolC family protein [Pseudoalteromonas citrea]TMP43157.1 RND transporter [Pseudoalteromonas citrea]TMP61698.1 RND transporter [Pseudoalteromonas citrea]
MLHKTMPYLVAGCLLLSGCNTTSEIASDYRNNIKLPETWREYKQSEPVRLDWVIQFKNPQLHLLIGFALQNNHAVIQQKLAVESARQRLVVSGSALWPSLDLTFDSSKRQASAEGPITNSHSLALSAKYELDLWGKLSVNEQRANLEFMAQQATYLQQQYELVAQVITAWFSVIEANKQQALLIERVALVSQNLEIIESGYQKGINSALDVYLARNEYNNEQAKVASQQAVQINTVRVLERLVGQYPSGAMLVDADLTLLRTDVSLGLPSELVSRKPQLVASWYQLLAKDAELAYAHKQRFPSINLNMGYGFAHDELDQLLSGSAIGWSLISGITAPIFNAGKLEANEALVQSELKSTEQSYLNTLYDAFSEVENAITEEKSLQARYQQIVSAAEHAQFAQLLSFEQYLKGLVTYTTVLDAQKRSFDAQSTLISIKKQLVTNRVALHVALGGDIQLAHYEEVPYEKN